jgi:hypothetical protein
VVGGLFIGVLSALPLVSLGNCCCLWIIVGGYLAAFVMQQNHPAPITIRDGASVGFLAGVFGAMAFAIAILPVELLIGPLQAEFVRRFLTTANDLPPEVRGTFEQISSAPWFVRSILRFSSMLVVSVIVAPVGGVLGALFSGRPPAAETAVSGT